MYIYNLKRKIYLEMGICFIRLLRFTCTVEIEKNVLDKRALPNSSEQEMLQSFSIGIIRVQCWESTEFFLVLNLKLAFTYYNVL